MLNENIFNVIKRNGSLEVFDFNKIKKMIDWASQGKNVNPSLLLEKFSSFVVNRISTQMIQDQLIKVALSLATIEEPEWADVAGSLYLLNIYKDHKAYMGLTDDSFGYIDLYNYIKRAEKDTLYDEDLYIKYSKEEIDYINSFIDIKYDQYDYSGIKMLGKRALVNIDGKVIEPPQYLLAITSLCALKNEALNTRMNLVRDYYLELANQRISPATPNISNLRKYKAINTASCFILKAEDNLESIYDTLKKTAIISKNGGASGVNFSSIRAHGSYIKRVKGAAKGVLPFLKLYNDTAVAVDQLGVRTGAITMNLDIWHYDILDFLDLRKENIDLRLQCQDLFAQVSVNDVFLRIYDLNKDLKEDIEDWLIFCPHEFKLISGINVVDLYGEEFKRAYDFALKLYQEYKLENAKMISSKFLMRKILMTLKETGLPYIFNKDFVNEVNPNKDTGVIYNGNLCVSGDTLVLTSNGYISISNLENKETIIWNGEEWSSVKPFKTSDSESLFNVSVIVEEYWNCISGKGISDSLIKNINCTAYHKWYLSDGKEVRTHELKNNDELLLWNSPMGRIIKTRVLSVRDLEIKDKVYCLTEPKRHTVIFNGIITGNCMESFSNFNEDLTHVCSLHSLNLANIHTDEELEKSVRYSVIGLNNIINLSSTPLEGTIAHNDKYRVIGIGALGYHDHLVLKKIAYSNSADYAYNLFEKIAYFAIDESVNEVSKYGKAEAFDSSEWNKGIFFGRNVYDPNFTKNEYMRDKWISLYEDRVKKIGMANTSLLAIAPNTSTSQLMNSSASVLPVYRKFFIEKNLLLTVPFAAKYLSNDTFWYYQEAVNMNPEIIIEVCQNIQAWVDQGISMELILNNNLYNNAKSLRDWYLKALIGDWKNKRSKTVYYLRPISKSKEEDCSSCAN